MTREEIVAGLKAGRTLNIVRSDAPELSIVADLEREGLVTTRLVEIDEQSSVLKINLKDPSNG